MSAKPGRNDPCPCGSGKKYKKCCINKEEPPEPLGLRPPPPVPAYAAPVDRRETDYLKDRKTDQKPPRTEFDDWYDVYEAGSPDHKLEMIRDLLAQDRPTEYYKDHDVAGIVVELRAPLGQEGEGDWVSLVREMREKRPDVFRLGATYFVPDMVHYYLRMEQAEAVVDVIGDLVAQALPRDEMTYVLLDLLHLAGPHEAARMLVMDVVSGMDKKDVLPWATDELRGMAVFFPFHTCIEAGCTDEAIAKLKEELAAMGCSPPPDRLNQIIAHRAGRADRQFAWDDFITRTDPDNFNLFLLTLDFGRWLTVQRGMPPITAEAMRSYLFDCLTTVNAERPRDHLDLPESAIERYLGRFFGFLSLELPRGVATLIAVRDFTEFLKRRGLIDKKRYEQRSAFWAQQWSRVEPVLREGWRDYAFLMRWW